VKFKSKYLGFTVYNEGKMIEFRNGKYQTDDKKEISFLKTVNDVEEVSEDTK